ncbi:(2Fe-2S)-binding protein [Pseudomonas hefeiensis]|uniref:(2Fe-2S)-binding protein n=1 Tax=Pseudomonas hefeiensis TaxID=2738125 RepID=A0ABY9G3N7_9PSED|nr:MULTISPECIES: (2Fe-2S)-binding protein [unclassified Pseudomonas]WLH10221.1 (2Fe-2S)-binding protein [Pseudomonas sp. FP205]WLH93303.1 (2Fe-2S)-binding protein [Pseudomonas sp. FP53]WLI37587.1 (2Fe-2S)-binding protein [Pseudomonas sp. FP821]
MSADSLFRALEQRDDSVQIEFEGRPIRVPGGGSLAAALLASGIRHTRESAVNGRLGAPYCMMGVCFECLVEVDGQANAQACLIAVRPGMQVRRQRGAACLALGEGGVDE